MLLALVSFVRPFQSPVLVFVVVLAVVLLVPVLFRRIRIPDIIGFILAGVAIGPHGLNLVGQDSIELFSTIGLLFLMFIVGLELDLNEFQRNKKKSLVFGLLTFFIPFFVGFPVCYFLLNYSLKASILIASMFSTHTLISYPIVSRLGLSRQESVMVVVGGTLFTDVAVLFILAFITGQSNNATSWWPLLLVCSVFLFIVFGFYVMPRVAKWFFKRHIDLRYSHFIFVLFTVFLLSLVAELAGLEIIIGAFSAGLILSRLIAHTSPLMNRLEFTGNSLFIPIFLISVGMLVDLKVLLNGPMAVTVAVVLTVVALFGKWLASYLTARWLKMRNFATRLIFGLSSSHAAATIAVVLVGFNQGIIDENVLNGTILLILITCVVSSIVTSYAAR
ncbi:MAG: cation:proton antiporter, partial [Breznakibacter sp.]|nr:cation:proton antiporter [Breznakibacter sp.]